VAPSGRLRLRLFGLWGCSLVRANINGTTGNDTLNSINDYLGRPDRYPAPADNWSSAALELTCTATIAEGGWQARMSARKPQMPVVIALANKMAKQVSAMLRRTRISGIRRWRSQSDVHVEPPAPVRR